MWSQRLADFDQFLNVPLKPTIPRTFTGHSLAAKLSKSPQQTHMRYYSSNHDVNSDSGENSDSAKYSEVSNDLSDSHHTTAPNMCDIFCSPSGNVFFKCRDNVVLRVEYFYLKANR